MHGIEGTGIGKILEQTLEEPLLELPRPPIPQFLTGQIRVAGSPLDPQKPLNPDALGGGQSRAIRGPHGVDHV